MKLSHFFIERPIFGIVISIVTVLLGAIAYTILPVAQFPEIAPPTVVVQAQYTYTPLYLSNYAYTQIGDTLKRIDGVGYVMVWGAQPYRCGYG